MTISERRFALREATGGAHAALEADVGGLASAAAYRRFVAGLYAGRAPVEAALATAAWPDELGGWRPQAIAADLAADLADLGVAVSPPGEPFALGDTVSDLLGAAYVLEGSQLGAKLVRKEAEKLGFSANFGARHLAAQTGTSGGWTRFMAVLDQADGYDPAIAASAANRVFAWLRSAMREESRAA